MTYIVNLNEVNLSDVNIVGGKNASTGEMLQNLTKLKINIPGGFATTVSAFKKFLSQNDLNKKISSTLSRLNTTNISSLNEVSEQIRQWIIEAPFSAEFINDITHAYQKLGEPSVAVRSSATTEDLATASFAGAQETYLNVIGLKNLLQAIKLVFASLYTSRAIAYRHDQGFDPEKSALSVGVQTMIRSDKAASGVIFTLDTESGFDKVILVTASYGLGEAIVQGQVNPDEFIVYKPALMANKMAILQRTLGEKAIKMIYTNKKNPKESIKKVVVSEADQMRFCIDDHEVQALAKQALILEQHYGKPMDVEWAKDGLTGELYIVQARPETVKSQSNKEQYIERYVLPKKSNVLAQGHSVGQRIGAGVARVILDPKKMNSVEKGAVLVTDMTDPDWEPIMKRASAIVTNRGGRTCHAAIIARELGIPAVIGCGNATSSIKENETVTVSCAEGQVGYVYAGKLPFSLNKVMVGDMPVIPANICLNVGNPGKAFINQMLPNNGVGLARLEFIISDMIGIHPNAVLQMNKLSKEQKKLVLKKTTGYADPVEFYIEKMREGISIIAAAFYPKQVIFRFSDFKSNEYANLIGGELFEPVEENPMLGFRGASRYNDDSFIKCFELECKAILRVREEMGLTNAQVMIPFARTVEELQNVVKLIETFGLKRGENGLKVFMMCEIPSNILLAHEFLKHVDGFSVGSNDLTQLVLGLDRDSALVASLFDERNEAVKMLFRQVIAECKKLGKYIGICGQAPSDYPEFAKWLLDEGMESISLSPDTIVETWLSLGRA